MIEVVNIKTYSMKDKDGTHVYIGSRMPNCPGSPLGNPFKPKSYDPQARQECLDRYRDWLKQQELSGGEAWYELTRLAGIAKTENLYLACWCAPMECHGDIVKAEIERINAE